MFRRKFWLSAALTIPVLVYAESIQDWFGFTAPEFTGSGLIPPVLSTIIFFYGGDVFLRGAWHEVRDRAPGMMTLISLAIVVAFGYSVATEIGLPGEPLYWELATLVAIMLLGHWIEMSSVQRASSALDELAKLLPDTAERIEGDQPVEVPVTELKVGDVILIRPGASVPVDGEIISGESSLNEAMMTGESEPVRKGPGDAVIGGTINGEGSLRVRVTKVGDETTLSGIMRIVEEAQSSRSRTQALADRAAFWLTIIAISAGIITFLSWWLFSAESEAFAISRTVTVLVIACPHALGLAIPLVVAISTSLSASNGLLVRNRLALELARDIDTVVFDKTGTLTRGEHGVTSLVTVAGFDENDALRYAAAIEGDSEHPIARAIRNAAREADVEPARAEDFESISGRGVLGRVDGHRVAVGGPRLLEHLEISPGEEIQNLTGSWGAEGQATIYLIIDDDVRAAFAIQDVIREESYDAVRAIKEQGMQVAMITGDSEAVARRVADELGIDEFFAQVLPEHKADKVKELQEQGRRVAMVGDGVNDAPALVTADIGIAIGAGTDVAIESADIVLVSDDPRAIVSIIKLSQATYRKMLQNLGWATGYNILAIPLAAGVLAPWGFILIPAVGALLMSASTVIVAINAQLLRRVQLGAVPAS